MSDKCEIKNKNKKGSKQLIIAVHAQRKKELSSVNCAES